MIDSAPMVEEYNKLVTGPRADDLGYRLRLTPDGQRAQWVEYDDRGGDLVHEDVPGEYLWLRLKNWLLLPIVGEDLL